MSGQPFVGAVAPGTVRDLQVSHLLKPDQIKTFHSEAYDDNGTYQFQEYPKALTPPGVLVETRDQEMRFRRRHKMRFQWETLNEPDRGVVAEKTEEYFANRDYPVTMTAAPVQVNSAKEEAALVAEWNRQPSVTEEEEYPKHFFHYEHGSRLVNSRRETRELGDGWFASPKEAIEWGMAQMTEQPRSFAEAFPPTAEDEKRELWKVAADNGVAIDKRWNLDRLKETVTQALAKTAA